MTSAKESLTEAVLRAYDGIENHRTKKIVQAAVRHLHAFAEDVGLAREEWAQGIDFLTAVGHACREDRQEFILLSDLLGLSMLVNAVDYNAEASDTQASVLGPFYVKGSPFIEVGASIILDVFSAGETIKLSGQVKDRAGQPLAGAILDFWQSAPNSLYAVQDPGQSTYNLRGRQRAGSDGRYAFITYKPTPYPVPLDGPAGKILAVSGRHGMRAAHFHFTVSAPGHHSLTTEIFLEGDPYLHSDAVFGVLPELVLTPEINQDKSLDVMLTGAFDFILQKIP